MSRLSGQHFAVPERCRVVDAHYLAPDIPSRTPAPFGVAAGVHSIPVNDLVRLSEAPEQFVIVGSGKTATDAIVWRIDNDDDRSRATVLDRVRAGVGKRPEAR
jgi:hypothetical protein